MPKNILMIGSTGVGKTEIARRLAKLADAPFIKVEATKFTEVGFYGGDVQSIPRDLLETAINNKKIQVRKSIESQASLKAVERILDALVGSTASSETRDKFRGRILGNEMDDTEIEIDVIKNSPAAGSFEIPGISGGAAMGVININDMLGKALGSNKMQKKKMTIGEAMDVVTDEESEKMIDQDKIVADAIKSVENDGIVFIDEIDKITSRSETRGGAEVSREGVQRDLLPLIEGTTVTTKYGQIKTDHILFIASGAFHLAKPSDLLPELQGRLPIRIEMSSLSCEDMIKILTEPEFNLIKQYVALMSTEGLNLVFNDDAISEIANYAANFNVEIEDIGARRLHTILEKITEDISYEADELTNNSITIDVDFVHKRLEGFIKNRDLAKFIL